MTNTIEEIKYAMNSQINPKAGLYWIDDSKLQDEVKEIQAVFHLTPSKYSLAPGLIFPIRLHMSYDNGQAYVDKVTVDEFAVDSYEAYEEMEGLIKDGAPLCDIFDKLLEEFIDMDDVQTEVEKLRIRQ